MYVVPLPNCAGVPYPNGRSENFHFYVAFLQGVAGTLDMRTWSTTIKSVRGAQAPTHIARKSLEEKPGKFCWAATVSQLGVNEMDSTCTPSGSFAERFPLKNEARPSPRNSFGESDARSQPVKHTVSYGGGRIRKMGEDLCACM